MALLPNVLPRILDANANPVSGGTATFYLTETSTLATVYADADLTTPLTNPVVADGGGLLPNIYLGSGVYRCVLKNAGGTVIREIDPVNVASGVSEQASVTTATAQSVASSIGYIWVAGYATAGDGGAALYKRVGSEPAHGGKLQTANGVWFELAEPIVSPAMFGLFTNATVTTATLKRAFDYAIGQKVPIALTGSYTVNGELTTNASVPDGALDLRLDGAVTITVDAASASIEYLILALSEEGNSHYISGGTLTILGNNKVQRGVSVGSASGETTARGEVVFSAPVRVFSIYAPAGSIGAAYGIDIAGPFERVVLSNPQVEDVARDSTLNATGDCKGIRITQVRGPVVVERPLIKRVLNSVQDADGVYVSSTVESSVPVGPLAKIIDGEFEDCQGRAIKTQTCRTEVVRPTISRRMYVSISGSVDIDAQFGSLVCPTWNITYRKNGSTSPLDASHHPFVIQALYNDNAKESYIGPGLLMTEAAMSNLVLLVCGANSPNHHVIVDGARVVAQNGLSTSVFTRSLVEFDGAQVAASSSKLKIDVRNTEAPNTSPLIGYSGYSSGALASKLGFIADNNRRSLTATSDTRTFYNIGGNAITDLTDYHFGRNDYSAGMYGAWIVDFSAGAMKAGAMFGFYTGTATVTGGPSGGDAFPADTILRVETGPALEDNDVWLTQRVTTLNGGTLWVNGSGSWSKYTL